MFRRSIPSTSSMPQLQVCVPLVHTFKLLIPIDWQADWLQRYATLLSNAVARAKAIIAISRTLRMKQSPEPTPSLDHFQQHICHRITQTHTASAKHQISMLLERFFGASWELKTCLGHWRHVGFVVQSHELRQSWTRSNVPCLTACPRLAPVTSTLWVVICGHSQNWKVWGTRWNTGHWNALELIGHIATWLLVPF